MREWLKTARKEKALTQKDVASALGISEGYYCAIETGERQRRLELTLAVKLSGLLGMSLDEIVTAEGLGS